MAEHATLSPSASARWISCPASIRMEKHAPPAEAGGGYDYAQEGTYAHTMGEIRASYALGKTTLKERDKSLGLLEIELQEFGLNEESIEDMRRHTKNYVDLILERSKEFPHSQVMLEQRVYPGLPACFGTADVIIVSPQHVEVIDLKYGQGIPVSAFENPQLKLYGVGALEGYGDLLGDTEIVRVTVYQPRLDSTSSFDMMADELRAWRDGLLPIAEAALGEMAEFGPSEEACLWCPVKADCRARMEYMTAIDFGTHPDLISLEEMGELLHRLPDIRDWCNALEGRALHALYSEGKAVPGWKAVMSGGRRSITDHAAAIQILIDAGFKAEQVTNFRAKGIGDLERLVGKKELPDLLGGLLAKGRGNPSLAHENDGRPAISPGSEASKDFDAVTDD